MILHKENIGGYLDVEESPGTNVIYTKTFTEKLLQVECKLCLYNMDEDEYYTRFFRHAFMVDASVTGTPTNTVVGSSFNDQIVGSSISCIISYTQSTSTLKVELFNDGAFATTVGCNWLLSVRVLKNS